MEVLLTGLVVVIGVVIVLGLPPAVDAIKKQFREFRESLKKE